MTNPPKLRIGSGFDIHPVSDDASRPLVLGGIEVSPGYGLKGHSDADVVCHALADALLGSIGMGGIGDHFPSDDPKLKDANSLGLLGECMKMVESAGWQLINGDVTVVAQFPKLALFLKDISASVSDVVGGPVEVKAKSPETIGALGQNKGIVAFASVLMWQPS